MKTKFAKEKSEYAHLIQDLLNKDMNDQGKMTTLQKIKLLEDSIKDQDDELIFIVTTRDTNPMKEKTAAPMTKDNIKKS